MIAELLLGREIEVSAFFKSLETDCYDKLICFDDDSLIYFLNEIVIPAEQYEIAGMIISIIKSR
ncbi:MAG: hypothetical protein WC716_09505 [Chitinophagaceae bacterium]|jgi:hypothetical protein